jgi:hypothetical protein
MAPHVSMEMLRVTFLCGGDEVRIFEGEVIQIDPDFNAVGTGSEYYSHATREEPEKDADTEHDTLTSVVLTIRAMTGGAGYAKRHLEHSDYYDEQRRLRGERRRRAGN